MTTASFDDREKAFENKYKHDQDLQFKVQSKAVRLFGLWAAEKLGKKGDDAQKYADEVLDSDFDEPGIKDVLRKVQKDFTAKGITMTDHHLENEYNVHLTAAKKALSAA
ncbi:MAG: DUF1476 domain-containing protein [Alphaproteobacteria bacterium]|nr:MAG: DUF1476 domain-containing protein [Alphaproteobacteria bacterium]